MMQPMTELAAVPRVPPHASALIWRDVSRELASLGFNEHDLGVISTAVEGFYDSFDTPIVFSPIFRGSNVASGSRLGVLIRLFQEGDRVPCDELGCLLSSSSLALLEEAGFLSKDRGDYVANGSLVPWGGGSSRQTGMTPKVMATTSFAPMNRPPTFARYFHPSLGISGPSISEPVAGR